MAKLHSDDQSMSSKIFSDISDNVIDHNETQSDGNTISFENNDRKFMEKLTKILFFLLLLVLIMSVTWMVLEGISNGQKNYHLYHFLVGLIVAFVCYPFATIVFRYFTNLSKRTTKIIHGSIMGSLVVMVFVAIFFMFQAKESSGKPHFTTLHDWIALFITVVMLAQLIAAIVTFSLDIVPVEYKPKIRDIHAIVGVIIQGLFLLAFLYALGRIFNKEKPFNIYVIGNITGILCIIEVILTLYLLSNTNYQRKNVKIE